MFTEYIADRICARNIDRVCPWSLILAACMQTDDTDLMWSAKALNNRGEVFTVGCLPLLVLLPVVRPSAYNRLWSQLIATALYIHARRVYVYIVKQHVNQYMAKLIYEGSPRSNYSLGLAGIASLSVYIER